MSGTVSGKPTKEIIKFARQAPGGVIRWGEAEMIYKRERPRARRTYIPHGVSRIFKRHFAKVSGVRGFYVLKQTIVGDNDGDVFDFNLHDCEDLLS